MAFPTVSPSSFSNLHHHTGRYSVLQHEYDHLNGVLHIDYLSRERKQQIQDKLRAIEMGLVQPDYPMRFAGSPGT